MKQLTENTKRRVVKQEQINHKLDRRKNERNEDMK